MLANDDGMVSGDNGTMIGSDITSAHEMTYRPPKVRDSQAPSA